MAAMSQHFRLKQQAFDAAVGRLEPDLRRAASYVWLEAAMASLEGAVAQWQVLDPPYDSIKRHPDAVRAAHARIRDKLQNTLTAITHLETILDVRHDLEASP
jgi:hypothetical protein